jgi:putative membrane protein
MVANLSSDDKKLIEQAIAQAERTTSAEIVLAIAPISDAYQSHILIGALVVGSLIDAGLWADKIFTDFPTLLVIQLAAILILSFIPQFRSLCVRLVPSRIKHRRAAHRAYEEYLHVSHHLPATTPIVLLYISLAERYAHILASRSVREKIAATQWDAIIQGFTASIASSGLKESIIGVIQRIATLLAQHFPETGEQHALKSHFIELKQ